MAKSGRDWRSWVHVCWLLSYFLIADRSGSTSISSAFARVERAPSPAALDFGVDLDLFYVTHSQGIFL